MRPGEVRPSGRPPLCWSRLPQHSAEPQQLLVISLQLSSSQPPPTDPHFYFSENAPAVRHPCVSHSNLQGGFSPDCSSGSSSSSSAAAGTHAEDLMIRLRLAPLPPPPLAAPLPLDREEEATKSSSLSLGGASSSTRFFPALAALRLAFATKRLLCTAGLSLQAYSVERLLVER